MYDCLLTVYDKFCVKMYVAAIVIIRRTSVRAGVLSRNIAYDMAEIIQRPFRSGNLLCPFVHRDGRHRFARDGAVQPAGLSLGNNRCG